MDAERIRELDALLKEYLANFDDCFIRPETREHLRVYVGGQLSDLPRKSVEPIALQAEVAPRTLQQFLSLLQWDRPLMRQRLQRLVATEHASPHSVGVLDDTGCPKKGTKTPGVQRQYCGATGKVDNCVATVHLTYAVEDFHCLLDNELFLPKEWDQDRDRCRAAGIPDDVVYRPKWQIALEQYDRALSHGVRFGWLTFDENYGNKPDLLRALDTRGQKYVAEMPKDFRGWLRPARLRRGPHGGLKRSHEASTVTDLLRYSPALRDQPWKAYRIKDGEKGPMVWEVRHVRFYPQTEEGDPARPVHLIVARNVLAPKEVKFFISNAPPKTRVSLMLLVAFSRWRIERCFEDGKTELGFDHYEGRNYEGMMRHQMVTAATYLFLARVREQWWGEKSGVDGVPGAYRHERSGANVVAGAASVAATAQEDGPHHRVPTGPERQGPQESPQANDRRARRAGVLAKPAEALQMELQVAL
jgi:SRSO17 transposase